MDDLGFDLSGFKDNVISAQRYRKSGHITWRHNSVLYHALKIIKSQLTIETEVYADLEGWKIIGGTIPADILVSCGKGSKPDMVLIDRNRKKIALLKLTCSLPQSTHQPIVRNKPLTHS